MAALPLTLRAWGPKKAATLRTQHRPFLGVEMLALACSLEEHHCLPLHTRTACPTATAGSFFVNSQELKRKNHCTTDSPK